METVRIDKFLWSARIYKTRTAAAEECAKHRVLVNGAEAKPSRNVRAGDRLTVKKPPIVYAYEIVRLTDKRQPAALVKEYVTDVTPQNELDKAELTRVAAFAQRDRGAGRPTKKERRDMEKLTSL